MATEDGEPADGGAEHGGRAPHQAKVVAVVALGGVLGALARYGAGLALPTHPGEFPLGTFLVNVVGCLAMGATATALARSGRPSHLLRPFLTTGVLGGFTTFSTYAVETDELFAHGSVAIGVAYAVGTLLLALGAVWAGGRVVRGLTESAA